MTSPRIRTGTMSRNFFVLVVLLGSASLARAQTIGTELHNMLMPASGGMGGVSIARPQDLTSAINGNPAALTQFSGTQVHFGGGWVEPTFSVEQNAPIPNPPIPPVGPLIEPFGSKSQAPGLPAGNIGITQDFSELGMPLTLGLGFITTSGAFADFRNVPASHGTNAGMAIFNLPVTAGVQITDELSLGAGIGLGIAFFDGPFVGVSGMTSDYALRGTVGADYQLNEFNTLGAYYQTEQSYQFDDAFTLNPGPGQVNRDVRMDLPQNLGLGFANNALMDGRLLLGVDLVYKLWDEAALYGAIYDNQLAVQVGGQYSLDKVRFRAGYVWADNPLSPNPGPDLGGVVQPGGIAAVRYSQALMAVTCQHRISFGIGVRDVLPGIDMDLMAGGMFRDTEQLGPSTRTSVASYWISTGMTWRFGRGDICRENAVDSWASE